MKFQVLVVLFCLFLGSIIAGCFYKKRIKDVNPHFYSDHAVLFGHLKIIRNKKDRTENAIVKFSNGETFQLGKEGFIALIAKPKENIQITRVIINDPEVTYKLPAYTLPDLLIRAGREGSKTYFGSINMEIFLSSARFSVPEEAWVWNVQNDWQVASKAWDENFKVKKGDFFLGLAVRLAPKGNVLRKVASDPEDPILGL